LQVAVQVAVLEAVVAVRAVLELELVLQFLLAQVTPLP